MSQGVKVPLHQALQKANCIVADLESACERIQIAGSIRRERPEIGDIEIVCIAKRKRDLIGEDMGSELDDRLAVMDVISKIKGGDRYKQFQIVGSTLKLDLFIVLPETWGTQLLIRTGSADFSKRFVTQKRLGGTLPDDMQQAEGRLWRAGKPLDTPEETDVFREAGVPWIHPAKRDAGSLVRALAGTVNQD